VDLQLEATLLLLLQQVQVVAPAGVRLLPAAAAADRHQLGRQERRRVQEQRSL
jgi:hypothetical protein